MIYYIIEQLNNTTIAQDEKNYILAYTNWQRAI